MQVSLRFARHGTDLKDLPAEQDLHAGTTEGMEASVAVAMGASLFGLTAKECLTSEAQDGSFSHSSPFRPITITLSGN